MPICGLYILLLDKKLPHGFRVQLAQELRQRASQVIPHLQKDSLRNVAFPTPYMTQAFYKNNRSFVECQEIHSKSATTV
uniref:Transposase n=1 Tax=Panagrellus redivivus TaxID=6233 RepID=A0A7E4UYL9_PANRE